MGLAMSSSSSSLKKFRDNNMEECCRNVEYIEASLKVLAIFDGHNGNSCSQFLEENFERYLNKYISKSGQLSKRQCEKIFIKLDKEFCEKDVDSGSTAVVAVFNRLEGDLVCMNVGDSRCVLSRDGVADRLSIDHKPTVPDERTRILRAGHNVWQNRLDGALMVSRAIGDKFLKYATVRNESNPFSHPAHELALTPVPSYRRIVLDNRDSFILLACDGLFETFTDQEAVTWIHERVQSLYRRRQRRLKRANTMSSPEQQKSDKSDDDDDDDSSSSDEASEEDETEKVDLDPDTMLSLVSEAHASGENLALELAGAAIAKGSGDNVSVTLCFLGNAPDMPLTYPSSNTFGFC